MGIAAYNRGSRAISEHITQELRKQREIENQLEACQDEQCNELAIEKSVETHGPERPSVAGPRTKPNNATRRKRMAIPLQNLNLELRSHT